MAGAPEPGARLIPTLVRVQPEGQTERTIALSVPGLTRVTLSPQTLGQLTNAPFSTLVESDRALVVDRTMSWDGSGYGSDGTVWGWGTNSRGELGNGSTVDAWLPIPVAGITYLLVRLVRQSAMGAWRGTVGKPVKRVLAVLAGVPLTLLLLAPSVRAIRRATDAHEAADGQLVPLASAEPGWAEGAAA